MLARILGIALISLLLQACGAAHIQTGKLDDDISSYNKAYVSDISVTSVEQNGDSLAMNEKMERYAESRIEQLIHDKAYTAVDNGADESGVLAFNLKVSVVYGSRAARYFVGFGAGKGSVRSDLTVIDSASKEVLYSSSAESDLSVGAFGGSMETVLRENIDKLLESYPKG